MSEISKALAPIVSKAINNAIEQLKSEIQLEIIALKSIPAPKDGINGIDGKDGTSVTIEDILPLIPEAKNGVDGKDGRDGVDGKDGTSITIDDILPLIPEVKHGIDGKDGRDGINGKDGTSVSLEDIQKLVDTEVNKRMALIPKAIDGINGKDGKDGLPGRDAAHIEILPGIDEAKSYMRGTFAKHNGGLFRSYEQTFGMKGWECIVDGIAELSVEQEGERIFKAKATLSSGQVTEKQMYIPAQIYKGVWVAGGYDVGDGVTWGGSQWQCIEPTQDKPGEAGSKGWKLSVKCGRNGKDGINGKDAVGVIKI